MFEDATPESDWLAGLIAADGCVDSSGRSWSLNQSGDHGRTLVRRVATMIGYEAKIMTFGRVEAATSYGIRVTSPRMTAALAGRYGVLPRKSLTLEWPDFDGVRAAAFLRGYIDGDGCVGVYEVGQTKSMLSISFVGTAAFIDGARSVAPDGSRVRRIERCRNLKDSRWNGRHAWLAGQWLYQHGSALPITPKADRFEGYGQLVAIDPPAWMTRLRRRNRVLELLAGGEEPMRVVELTGEQYQNVYRWRAEARFGPVDQEIGELCPANDRS